MDLFALILAVFVCIIAIIPYLQYMLSVVYFMRWAYQRIVLLVTNLVRLYSVLQAPLCFGSHLLGAINNHVCFLAPQRSSLWGRYLPIYFSPPFSFLVFQSGYSSQDFKDYWMPFDYP